MQNKEIKYLDNVIGISGFPGVGKSTLIKAFFDRGYKVSFEFDDKSNDKILSRILNDYFIGYFDAYLIQIGFINHSIKRYKKIIKNASWKKPVFIDRLLIENKYFAYGQIKNEKLFEIYQYEHQKKYETILYDIGLPKLCFHLTTKFNIAMDRLKTRDKNEYEEKMKNIQNFKLIYNFYENVFEKELSQLNIEYISIDTTNKTAKQVYETCVNTLVKRGTINRIIQ